MGTELNSNLLLIKSGITGGSVPANSYKDFTISWGTGTFSSPPAVMAVLSNVSVYYSAYACVQYFVLNVTSTSATIRIMNGYANSGIEPYVTWVAIGI